MQRGIDAPAVHEIREPEPDRKLSLIRDPNDARKDLALAISNNEKSPIRNPVDQSVRIGLYRPWMSNMDEGWTRFVFDTFNVPYKSVNDAEVRTGDLKTKYDVLIFASQRSRDILEGNASGSYPPEFTGGITQTGVTNLKTFVERGGSLVCFDAACDLMIKQFELPMQNVLEGVRSTDFFCPGSVVALELDRSQPLAAGVTPKIDAFFINSSAFESSNPRVRIVARYARENVLRSGWLLGEDKIRGKIAMAEVSVGQGRIVLFAFRPQHRGQTWGTFPLLWNTLNRFERRG
jgi:hypothetical protein